MRRIFPLFLISLLNCGSSEPAPKERPCGTQVGDTLCDLEVEGYFRVGKSSGVVTESAFSRFKVSDVAASAKSKYLFVFNVAYWCGACREAAIQAVNLFPSIGEKAQFVQLMTEGETPTDAATRENLDRWISIISPQFSTGKDAANNPFSVRRTLGALETAYIVDRATMKIITKKTLITDGLEALQKAP
jgi:thiol-disulfide isomerase/thioredoxin